MRKDFVWDQATTLSFCTIMRVTKAVLTILTRGSSFRTFRSVKGDIAIGIHRYSVDAWMYPHLFNEQLQVCEQESMRSCRYFFWISLL